MTNDGRALLSVVVPSYNQGSYLGETLAEPCNYLGDVEVLVIDGGSTDASLSVIKTFESKLAFWASGRDGGQAAAINKGLELSTGRWVAFQNSDDFYLPGALSVVLEQIRLHPEAEMIVGGTLFTDKFGNSIRKLFPKPIFTPCMSRMNFLNNQSLFVRRDLFEKVGFLKEDARFCLDYEWFVRLLRQTPNILYIRQMVGAQRFHEETKTSNLQNLHDLEFSQYSKFHFSGTERFWGRMALPFYRLFRFLFGLHAKFRRVRTFST